MGLGDVLAYLSAPSCECDAGIMEEILRIIDDASTKHPPGITSEEVFRIFSVVEGNAQSYVLERANIDDMGSAQLVLKEFQRGIKKKENFPYVFKQFHTPDKEASYLMIIDIPKRVACTITPFQKTRLFFSHSDERTTAGYLASCGYEIRDGKLQMSNVKTTSSCMMCASCGRLVL